MDIAVIGLGKLGLCTATCFAGLGSRVIGYDNNESNIKKLEEGQCYIDEDSLEENLSRVLDSDLLIPTSSIKHAIACSNRAYVIVPTPSCDDGLFSNYYIMDVLSKIAPVIKEMDRFYVINIVSTVMPGSCDRFITYLENATGKTAGVDFGLTYNPEFIAIGSVIENFLYPDMVLIGHSDPKSRDIIMSDYKLMDCPIHTMSLTSAEITKLSLNFYLTTKISFVNELATICENVVGADIDAITNAIGSDTRIGSKLMKAGLGFGGPCLPRDGVAFKKFSTNYGAESHIAPAVAVINKKVISRIAHAITTVDYGSSIDIFGMSYKSGTALTEGSQSILLKDELESQGYNVTTHDKQAEYEESPDVIVMMSDSIDLPKGVDKAHTLLVDPWRRFKNEGFTKYYGMGIANV